MGFDVALELSTFKFDELDENMLVKIESNTVLSKSICALNIFSFTLKVPSFAVLTPNSERYTLSLAYPTIGPVIIELMFLTIFLTAIFLDNGPASVVCEPGFVNSLSVVLVLFIMQQNLLMMPKPIPYLFPKKS